MAIVESIVTLTVNEPDEKRMKGMSQEQKQTMINDFETVKRKAIESFINQKLQEGLKPSGEVTLTKGDITYEFKLKGNFVKNKEESDETN